jgi:hypothetical protein
MYQRHQSALRVFKDQRLRVENWSSSCVCALFCTSRTLSKIYRKKSSNASAATIFQQKLLCSANYSSFLIEGTTKFSMKSVLSKHHSANRFVAGMPTNLKNSRQQFPTILINKKSGMIPSASLETRQAITSKKSMAMPVRTGTSLSS